MTHKMLKITPDHIKRLLAEPDVTSAVAMLEGIPAFDEVVVRHMYGDAAAMTDAEFEQFLQACGQRRRH